MKNLRQFLVILFVLCVFSLSSNAQSTSVLTGTVSVKSSGSKLPGANVFIAGTSFGTITDINGEYTLSGIPNGEYTIICSFVSFQKDSIQLSFSGGESMVWDVPLKASTVGLEEVVITTQLLGQRKAINQQLKADAIVNVVSDDKIQELPDVNAAEAIARLPGIALNRSGGEGQKVIIRGMEPKFSAITINGVRFPSNSSSDRSVDLSLISPELLSGIEVFKSPLPDMEAESSAGTVNLKLRKAPNEPSLLVKGLSGYNQLNKDFGDYKGVLQFSNRVLNDKIGFVGQTTLERFNRGGDEINYSWGQGPTDEETGITEIEGRNLSLSDVNEIRKRVNASLNMDYEISPQHSLTFFGLFSRTSRDRFGVDNEYNPGEPRIRFTGKLIDNQLDMTSYSLGGDHTFGRIQLDWNLSSSTSQGKTPTDFLMNFNAVTIGGLFDPDLNRTGHPKTYLGASSLDTDEIYLINNDLYDTETFENTKSAFLNMQVPVKFNATISGTFKAGGRYSVIDRNRKVEGLSERFYYLGTDAVWRAEDLYEGELAYIPSNGSLISMENFRGSAEDIGVELENGESFPFPASLDEDKIKDWSEDQESNFAENRYAQVDNYEVVEKISAGYAMFKLNIGNVVTFIPGFRYEYSDNEYFGYRSTADGTYGQNGEVWDTTTIKQYGEFFPHLHLKIKPFDWFDIRASYAKTIARPNFTYIIPGAAINNSSLSIDGGNPNLTHAMTTSYDLSFSFFNRKFGLFTIGAFYKDIDNIFVPRSIILTDSARATDNGWEGYQGYELTSYTNLPDSKVYGYELELQSNLAWLPMPFKGLVFSLNYARLYSETEVFFLTSETVFGGGFPPIPQTTYYENERTVTMPTQAPHIFRASVGYDYKGFSLRVSTSYQGTKARTYSLNKDFDSYDLEFWRWDASVKQNIGRQWSVFINLNNISNQQDIRFTRNENYIRTIETYGMTGTIGLQYRFKRKPQTF